MILRLEFPSDVKAVDLVQILADRVAADMGLDEESVHWVGIAVRESVINAITHGNQNDPKKLIFVEFETATGDGSPCLIIRVRDQGRGFDPATIADPLAPENLLKPGGRGVFLIRQFMDDVRIERSPTGGTELQMIKRVSGSRSSIPRNRD